MESIGSSRSRNVNLALKLDGSEQDSRFSLDVAFEAMVMPSEAIPALSLQMQHDIWHAEQSTKIVVEPLNWKSTQAA